MLAVGFFDGFVRELNSKPCSVAHGLLLSFRGRGKFIYLLTALGFALKPLTCKAGAWRQICK
jgi:hypothetical protein